MPEIRRALPRLMVLTDLTRAPLAAIVQRLSTLAQRARPGSVLFTVRDYAFSSRTRLALATGIAAAIAGSGQSFGLADRADLALALGAAALHLPESGLTVDDARRLLPPSVLISRACHDLAAARRSRADALLFSPIMAPRKERAAWGARGLAEVCAALADRASAPAVFALGGVDASNARECLLAGAAGVAVIGAALEDDASPLLRALDIER